MARIAIEVTRADALTLGSDVLALKYAQDLYGVDDLVAERLAEAGRQVRFPEPWDFRLEKGVPGIAATRLLFVGVPRLREFGYREIRMFARKVLSALAGKAPETKHLALTVHGPGYGLDEAEAFEAEIAGLVDAIRSHDVPEALERITIVERNAGRAKRLQVLLAELLQNGFIEAAPAVATGKTEDSVERLRAAGYASDTKAHVFVAMPFKEEMDDVYHYGIQSAVRASGFLCERADLSSFTGDVLEWVRTRIKSASLVVADLTDANPNVYLEVGFAWGCGVPTVLLVRDTQQLKFDVRGQRCLVYKKIKDLEEALGKELKALR
jgi:hypothetical protein